MKNYEETIDSVLDRVHAYEADQKRKRRKWKRIAVSFGCFCLVALVGLGIWQTAAPSGEESREFPSLTLDGMTVPSIEFHKEWNGKSIGYNLNKAIEQSEENERFFIYASCHSRNSDFVYQGKTLKEYEEEREREWRRWDMLLQLLKLVDEVQNMKDVYQISTPEQLATVLYGIEFYGKELLEEYVVDGAFQLEKAEADYAVCCQEKAQEAYNAACKAYVDQMLEEVKKQLDAQNIRYKCQIGGGNGQYYGYVVVDVSVKEFASLTLDHLSDWYFDLYGDLTTPA